MLFVEVFLFLPVLFHNVLGKAFFLSKHELNILELFAQLDTLELPLGHDGLLRLSISISLIPDHFGFDSLHSFKLFCGVLFAINLPND